MFASQRKGRVSLLHLLVVLSMMIALFPLSLPVASAAPAADTATQGENKLSKNDQDELAKAQVNGVATVKLVIASKRGANQAALAKLQSLGGKIQYQSDKIDYLRVEMPVEKVKAAAALAEVQALELGKAIPLENPSEPQAAGYTTPQTPPGKTTPRINPYMPIGDTGAAQFAMAHPEYDGRETTIAIVDSGVDLVHPALQKTTTGERKIIDWVSATDPVNDNDVTWVKMATVKPTNPTTIVYNGVTYRIPREVADPNDEDVVYRIGIFDERDPRMAAYYGNDVNRDGNPAGSKGTFAVIWRQEVSIGDNIVRVDTNQDNDFRNDKAMTDYKINNDINYFGKDNPNTAVSEAVSFAVQTWQNGTNAYVNIGITTDSHGSHVAGITSGNGLFGGKMTGAAPGAKLVSIQVCIIGGGCTNYALIEGMNYAVNVAHVDVINMSIGGLPALNDGNNTRATLYNRLIEDNQVQMFISAGNDGPGLNTAGDPAVATNVMSVGSYVTKATWQSNYGSDSAYVDNLHPFTSVGPREDGGFKPQIVAPGAAVSTVPMWIGAVQVPSGPTPGSYTLPPGYDMFNGTSMASPQAAGAAALLVSAYKEYFHKERQDAAVLRKAINSTARYIDPTRYTAAEQGNGLFNVPAAFDLLTQDLSAVNVTSRVPVNTVLSGFLAEPGFGVGIYDREGVTLGVSYSRTYTFTRTSGGAGTKTYDLKWVGNDGTFSTASSIALPLNTPVTLAVNINPSQLGLHSAILNLDDPTTPGIEAQTMNTVVVPNVFTTANNGTVTTTSTVGRNQVLNYYFKVPVGTPALKVDFSGPSATPGTGQARFLRFHPYGVTVDSPTNSLGCYSPPVNPGGSCGRSPNSASTTNPLPGVWEVTVEARRTSDIANVPFTLTVSILGATVSPNPLIINNATVNVPINQTFTFTNLFGAFTGNAVGSTLGSAKIARPTINDLAQQQYVVSVTAGSTRLRAKIGNTSDLAADLDLFVYNCTSGSCVLAGQSADGDAEEEVIINNPAAGTWVVLVDGYSVPSGSTAYDYLDVFTNTAFGNVVITDPVALHPAGSTWTAPGVITAKAVPAAGRILYGTVSVLAGTVTVGSGEVRILNVTP